MSSNVSRSSRTAKPKPKPNPTERKSAVKKATPAPQKTKTPAHPAARTEAVRAPASKAKAAPPPAEKKPRPTAVAPAKPVKAKKTEVMKAEEPKKKAPRVAAKKAAPAPAKPDTEHTPEESEVTSRPIAAEAAPETSEPARPAAKSPRGRKPKAAPVDDDEGDVIFDDKPGSKPRSKNFEPSDEFLDDDLPPVEEEDVIPEDLGELDPLDLPLALLDPELAEVPRPATPPKLKPKPVKSERRQQNCAGCGQPFGWLSVDQLCFNCLKKKLAQRKREDESYSGFSGEVEEEDDAS